MLNYYLDYNNPKWSPFLRLRDQMDEWQPACDVEEAKEHYLLTLEMPGIPKDQIKIDSVENKISVSAERHFDEQKKSDGTWYSERRFGKFHRSFNLPSDINAEKIEANYSDGVLRIFVPKAESAKPRQIKITNGASTGFLGRLIGQSNPKEKEDLAS